MTDKSILRFFWYCMGLTLPFFAVSFARINLGVYHFALPSVFMILILVAGAFMFCLPNLEVHRLLKEVPRKYLNLVILTYLFVLWHLIGFIQSTDVIVGLKDVFKIIVGVVTFWGTLLFFPRDEKFISRFFMLAFYGWLLMLARLIYQYAFVFHSLYLATDLDYEDRYGKNQLAVHLVVIFFYAFFYLWRSKNKLAVLPPFAILCISIVYTGSRMAWAAIFLGMLFLIFYILWQNRREGLKLLRYFLIGGGIFFALTLALVARYVDIVEISTRFLSIYAPEQIDEEHAHLGKHSYDVRGSTLKQAWDGFLTSPIIGVGLRNTLNYVERLTHNDYMAILLELGVIGLGLFLVILWKIWQRAKLPEGFKNRKLPWFSFASRGSVIGLLICSNFFNSYGSAYYWLYLALFLVLIETERLPHEAAHRQ